MGPRGRGHNGANVFVHGERDARLCQWWCLMDGPDGEILLLRVFRAQSPRLWGFLLRNLADPETAEDLMQEAFMRVWDHREELAAELKTGDRDAVRRYLWRVGQFARHYRRSPDQLVPSSVEVRVPSGSGGRFR